MFRLREVGVAPQADLLEACCAAQGDRAVEVPGRLLVAGAIARAVDHVQRLAGVGQREHQGVIAPLALVVDVHSLLALARGLGHRAVGVEHRLGEERRGLLPPDLAADGVEHLLQAEDVALVEAAAEVAGGGGVGHPPRAQGVEVGLVAAQPLEVLQTAAAGQQVVGDVEHVVRLVVGPVQFEQGELVVDRRIEPQPLHQQVDRTDPAVERRPGAVGDLVVDVAGAEHRPPAVAAVILVQAAENPPLATRDLFAYLGVHSKTSVRRVNGLVTIPIELRKPPKVFEFFHGLRQECLAEYAWLRSRSGRGRL